MTSGYHGDLHTGNLFVIFRNRNGNGSQIQKVLIFDYGAHTRFNKKLTRQDCKSIESMFKTISRNFNLKKKKANRVNEYPLESGIEVIEMKLKQSFRNNSKMMKLLNAQRPYRPAGQSGNGSGNYPLIPESKVELTI